MKAIPAAICGIVCGVTAAALNAYPVASPVAATAPELAEVITPAPIVFTIPETSADAADFLARPIVEGQIIRPWQYDIPQRRRR